MSRIIDAHAHIGSWPTIKKTEKNILESNRKYGISFCIVSDCDCSEIPSFDAFPPHKVTAVTGLKTTLRFVKAHPDILGAAVWVNPRGEKVSEELRTLIKKNRKYIYAMKFHPFESHLKASSPKFQPYIELAKEFSLPILVHTADDKYSDIAFLEVAAKKNPDVIFIAAHMQLCSDNKAALEALKHCPNLYGDTAWVKMNIAKKTLVKIGEDRIMFGTDNPIDGIDTLGNPMYQSYFKNKVKLPRKLYENLMYRNAIKIYGITLKK